MGTYKWAFLIAGAACVVCGVIAVALRPPKPGVLKWEMCLTEQILAGMKKPTDCPVFGTECTPDCPRGGLMSDPNGPCARAYQERKAKTANA
jgi:hydrogenase maturation factor